MFGYRIPAPNQAMLVSGGRRAEAGLPFRVVTGHGAFVMPVVRKASFLTLALQEAVVTEDCVTKQGIALSVRAVIAFKIGSDLGSIVAAAQRFLADQGQMSMLTGQIFSGHLRSIVGSMTVEDIIRERQTLAENVLDGSKGEMASLGLAVDSLQIQSIDDMGSGYIKALAAPHVAAINQNAKIAQAEADRAAAEAHQSSERQQAEYARATAVARATYQVQIDQALARTAQAGPLAAAQAQQEVLVEQAKVAARTAELREAQLQSEVIRPARAEADRIRILAEAQAASTTLSARAAAAEGRIALDQAVIAQLPELVRAAAGGLANANLTVLDGADGLNGTVASLASQGTAVLRAVMDGLGSRGGDGPRGGATAAPDPAELESAERVDTPRVGRDASGSPRR